MTYPFPKPDWGDGPWQSEPDHLEWRFRGVPCIISRSPMGSWCGYVAVPKGHPWYDLPYDSVEADVHGGLTFAGPCQGHVCHKPLPGEADDVWWVGFDCSHWGDHNPSMNFLRATQRRFGLSANPFKNEEEYRTQAWVMAETERLAGQVIEKAKA